MVSNAQLSFLSQIVFLGSQSQIRQILGKQSFLSEKSIPSSSSAHTLNHCASRAQSSTVKFKNLQSRNLGFCRASVYVLCIRFRLDFD